jgi:hypothetical protein
LKWRAKERRQLKLEAEEQAHRMGSHSGRRDEAPVVSPDRVPRRWADPKPYARFVVEPLGTREDFKKDSGANFAAARCNKL